MENVLGSKSGKKRDIWKLISLMIFVLFLFFLLYPLIDLLKQAVLDSDGSFSLSQFQKFFSKKYYYSTLINSFKVTVSVTIVSLLLGVPFAYFYAFYRIKGAKLLFVLSLLCCMSPPFIGAYSWILLLGRTGLITGFIENIFGVSPNIYGYGGILLVQSLKFYPLVFIYMNGVFKNIDSTLLEAAESMGCTGVKRFFRVVAMLSMPTMLAAALLVFMRAFADFGTPMLIGEGYRTFPVEIYTQYLGETGGDHSFAAAICVIAVILTALIFLIQKVAVKRFEFSMSSLHPVEKKRPNGIQGILIYFYEYGLVSIAFLPQLYIVVTSFRNCNSSIFTEGYSFMNYKAAAEKLLARSTLNTILIGGISLCAIIALSILIAYLVVRRSNPLNGIIDTFAMLPYILPGSVIGIALITAFGKKPFALAGTFFIMVLALVIRRMPYTIRSATATLMQVPITIEEAAISLGTSQIKTFVKITVPMMANGIISGAILSWVAIVTELSSAVILYNNRTITLTMSTYAAVSVRGLYGVGSAFAAVLMLLTTVSLLIFLAVSKSEDISV